MARKNKVRQSVKVISNLVNDCQNREEKKYG